MALLNLVPTPEQQAVLDKLAGKPKRRKLARKYHSLGYFVNEPHFLIIRGDPIGYYAEGQKPNWKRKRAYEGWKKWVQCQANCSGLALPLRADAEHQIFIGTCAYFRNGTHADPENIRKGISDALFYGGGSDKHCGGWFAPPKYDANNPHVEVEIKPA